MYSYYNKIRCGIRLSCYSNQRHIAARNWDEIKTTIEVASPVQAPLLSAEEFINSTTTKKERREA